MTIKQYRESLKLSSEQFAWRFQIPINTLIAWESGTEETPAYVIQMIHRLAEAERIKPNFNPMYDSEYLISHDGESKRYLVELFEDELLDLRSEINTILKRKRVM